jgi:hypothetical protein
MVSHKVHPLVALGVAGGLGLASGATGYLLGRRQKRQTEVATAAQNHRDMMLSLHADGKDVSNALREGDLLLTTVELLMKYANGRDEGSEAKSLAVKHIIYVQPEISGIYEDVTKMRIKVCNLEKWKQLRTVLLAGNASEITINLGDVSKNATLKLVKMPPEHPWLVAGNNLSGNTHLTDD